MNVCGYEIIFQANKRYYVENIIERKHNYEFTTPYSLKINDDVTIMETKWIDLIAKVAYYLVSTNKVDEKKLLEYHTDWTSSDIFSSEKKTNHKLVKENLYLNCNHTALHSVWLIRDLLCLYEYDLSNVVLTIHRPTGAEPKEVCNYFIEEFNKGFKEFLKQKYHKSDDAINTILNNISVIMNKRLNFLSKSYIDFRIFDDKYTLSNYVSLFNKHLDKDLNLNQDSKDSIKRYLKYIQEYYALK